MHVVDSWNIWTQPLCTRRVYGNSASRVQRCYWTEILPSHTELAVIKITWKINMKHRLHSNSCTLLRISACLSCYFCYWILLLLWHRVFLNFYFLRISFYILPTDCIKQPINNKCKQLEVIVQSRWRPRKHSLSIFSTPVTCPSSTNRHAPPLHYFVSNLRPSNKQKEISRREFWTG